MSYRRTSRTGLAAFCFLVATCFPQFALAVTSAEVYTAASYGYGRVEARLRFAAGDGVVGSFFLWKDGSELAGTFWNELDFEKVGADCRFQSNALYGNPASNHNQSHPGDADPCGTYHVYAFDWTPDYIAWLVDGVEIRRDTGAAAAAFAQNVPSGMQVRFNVWPGDASFGGNFNPNILPVHQYVDWVQFSSFEGGTFTLAWREDFNAGALPVGWNTANWKSPKNLSTHENPRNVNFIDGCLVLSLTADDALGSAGAVPGASGGSGGAAQAGTAGTSDSGGNGGSGVTAGSAGAAGTGVQGGSTGTAGSGDSSGAQGQAPASDASDDGGCSINAPGPGHENGLLGVLTACAVVLWRKRRRQRGNAGIG